MPSFSVSVFLVFPEGESPGHQILHLRQKRLFKIHLFWHILKVISCPTVLATCLRSFIESSVWCASSAVMFELKILFFVPPIRICLNWWYKKNRTFPFSQVHFDKHTSEHLLPASFHCTLRQCIWHTDSIVRDFCTLSMQVGWKEKPTVKLKKHMHTVTGNTLEHFIAQL